MDFIKYHFEVFIHKIHTILEVQKLMVNDFYKIGLKEEDCNWNNLKKHKDFRNSNARKVIEAYFKSFKHLIKLRHINTHRGQFTDKESDELKSDLVIYNGLEKFNIEVGEDFKRIRPKFIVDYEIKLFKKERLEYISKSKEIVETYIDNLINVILVEFYSKK